MVMMKACAVTEVGKKAEVVDVPRPEPGDDGVLVKTHFSGVSVGTEMWVATGQRDDISHKLPFVNGYQFSGEVAAIGKDVVSVKPGDMVAGFGGGAHAEYALCKTGSVWPVRRERLRAASCFVMPMVASNGLNHAGVSAGESVMVIGQGMIGQCAAMLARMRGAWVFASEPSKERRAISVAHCADVVFDPADGPVPEQLRAHVPGGADTVCESTGFGPLIDEAIRCCQAGIYGQGGKLVHLGWYPGRVSYDFSTAHNAKICAFYPAFIGESNHRAAIIRMIDNGLLNLEPLISHTVGWRQSGDVYTQLFTEARNHFNAIVFDWRT